MLSSVLCAFSYFTFEIAIENENETITTTVCSAASKDQQTVAKTLQMEKKQIPRKTLPIAF